MLFFKSRFFLNFLFKSYQGFYPTFSAVIISHFFKFSYFIFFSQYNYQLYLIIDCNTFGVCFIWGLSVQTDCELKIVDSSKNNLSSVLLYHPPENALYVKCVCVCVVFRAHIPVSGHIDLTVWVWWRAEVRVGLMVVIEEDEEWGR